MEFNLCIVSGDGYAYNRRQATAGTNDFLDDVISQSVKYIYDKCIRHANMQTH